MQFIAELRKLEHPEAGAAPEGAAGRALAMLTLSARCRIGEGADELAALPPDERLHLLKLLVTTMPATPALAAIARETVMTQAAALSGSAALEWPYRRAEPEMSERMLAVWSGLTPTQARWGELTALDRIVCITRLVSGGTPTSADFDAFMNALETPTDREAMLVAWCRERDWSASEAEVQWLSHTEAPMVRLEAMASVLSRTDASRLIATEWIADAERAWKSAPKDNLGRALSDARFSAVLSAAGDSASAEGLLGHALAGADRENEPKERARIYRIALEAAAGLALHDARGSAVEPWLRAVEKVTNDKALLRNREAFLDARAAAVRTLRRAALSGGDVAVDRGHQTLKEMARRVPERWLDLLLWASVANAQAKAGRNTELLLTNITDVLRKEGVPRPIPNITLDEIVHLLMATGPERVLAMGLRIVHPVRRALWLATAAPWSKASTLGPQPSSAT